MPEISGIFYRRAICNWPFFSSVTLLHWSGTAGAALDCLPISPFVDQEGDIVLIITVIIDSIRADVSFRYCCIGGVDHAISYRDASFCS